MTLRRLFNQGKKDLEALLKPNANKVKTTTTVTTPNNIAKVDASQATVTPPPAPVPAKQAAPVVVAAAPAKQAAPVVVVPVPAKQAAPVKLVTDAQIDAAVVALAAAAKPVKKPVVKPAAKPAVKQTGRKVAVDPDFVKAMGVVLNKKLEQIQIETTKANFKKVVADIAPAAMLAEHKAKFKNVLADIRPAAEIRAALYKARNFKPKFPKTAPESTETVKAPSFFQRNKGLIFGFATLAVIAFGLSFLIPGAPLVAAATIAVKALFGASLSAGAVTALVATGLTLFAATIGAISAGLGALVGFIFEKATSKKAAAPVVVKTENSSKQVLASVGVSKEATKQAAPKADAVKTVEVAKDAKVATMFAAPAVVKGAPVADVAPAATKTMAVNG